MLQRRPCLQSSLPGTQLNRGGNRERLSTVNLSDSDTSFYEAWGYVMDKLGV